MSEKLPHSARYRTVSKRTLLIEDDIYNEFTDICKRLKLNPQLIINEAVERFLDEDKETIYRRLKKYNLHTPD